METFMLIRIILKLLDKVVTTIIIQVMLELVRVELIMLEQVNNKWFRAELLVHTKLKLEVQ